MQLKNNVSIQARSAARAIAICAKNNPDLVGDFTNMTKIMGDEGQNVRGICCIGEYGKVVDLTANQDLINIVINFFKPEFSKQVHEAASIAFGNIVLGGPKTLMPLTFEKVQAGEYTV